MIEKRTVLVLTTANKVRHVGLLFLMLFDLRTHPLRRFAFQLVDGQSPILVVEDQRCLRSSQAIELSVLLLTRQNAFVKKLVVLP